LRQAGAELTDGLCIADESLKPIERLRDHFRDLKQRWDNRLVLERCSLAELYLHGRLEVVIHGDWVWGFNEYTWACRIKAEAAITHFQSASTERDVPYFDDIDRRDKEVVFVVVVDGAETPKSFVRSIFRPYVFRKKFFKTGDGLLYRRETGVGYEIFPFNGDGEMWFGPRIISENSDYAASEMVKRGPEVLDDITDDACKDFWDIMFGPVGKLVLGRVEVYDRIATFPNVEFIESSIEGVGTGSNLINVSVGPLNL
jgi:hypothetical protein